MKIKKEHLAVLKEALLNKMAHLDMPAVYAQYKRDGLSDARFCWDILWQTTIQKSTAESWLLYNLNYLNDSHIETALKSIILPRITSS